MLESNFQCAYCGHVNATTVDRSAGLHQSCVEDCEICCRPNVLEIDVDAKGRVATITATQESN